MTLKRIALVAFSLLIGFLAGVQYANTAASREKAKQKAELFAMRDKIDAFKAWSEQKR